MAVVTRRLGDWRVRRAEADGSIGLLLEHRDGRAVVFNLVDATAELAEVFFRTLTLDQIEEHVATLVTGENIIHLGLDKNASVS